VQEQGALRVGVTIGGRYRLIAPLGAGGFGVAYRAWDNTAGIPVVLKMPLAKHLVRPAIVERFAREVTRLRESNHPHIVPIVGDGVDAQGRPYLVMRFLPGGSLSHRRKPAGASALHRWLPAIAGALDYTHSLGVLHRDVKPSNIFFDTQARAYLGDFGIARVAEELDDESPSAHAMTPIGRNAEESLTETGSLMGTAVYMAPEAFEHRPQFTPQADQYSLAVSVYEMLSGKFPFNGKAVELRAAHQKTQTPPLETHVKGLPPSLYAAVGKGLGKHPDTRFATCQQFARAVLADVPFTPVDASHHRFLCPACHRLVRVPENFGGRACRCPNCSARLKVSRNIDALWREEEAFALEPRTPSKVDALIAAVLAEEQQATHGESQHFSQPKPQFTNRGGRLTQEGDEAAADAEKPRKHASPAQHSPAGRKQRFAAADPTVDRGTPIASDYATETHGGQDSPICFLVPDDEVGDAMPRYVAREHEVFPMSRTPECLCVATSDSGDIAKLETIRFVAECDVRPIVTPREAIAAALESSFGLGEVLWRLANMILREACALKVDAISFEPLEDCVLIRYKRDGGWEERDRMNIRLREALVREIKLRFHLDVRIESQKQEGGATAIVGSGARIPVHARVVPTKHGQSVMIVFASKPHGTPSFL
jgi:serine/threonine protein kinase